MTNKLIIISILIFSALFFSACTKQSPPSFPSTPSASPEVTITPDQSDQQLLNDLSADTDFDLDTEFQKLDAEIQ